MLQVMGNERSADIVCVVVHCKRLVSTANVASAGCRIMGSKGRGDEYSGPINNSILLFIGRTRALISHAVLWHMITLVHTSSWSLILVI